jgi:imidazolonepropionase-like amidohydrolase
LRHGITSIREMGAVGGTNHSLHSAQREGLIVGPRLFSCGMALAITGGHAYEISIEVDGIDAVRTAARAQLKDGADFIKVMASNEPPMPNQQEQTVPQFSLDELRVAADEAHDAGVHLCAHVCGSKAIERCLDAGVDSIEHGVYLNRDLAQRMKEQGTFYTPTLGIYRANTYPHWLRGGAKAAFCRQVVEDHRASFVHALDAGLRWTVGTDAIVPLVDEMQFLVDEGLSLETVLEAVIVTNAQLIERESELGAVKPGRTADLIVVDGDPLTDLSALKRIRLIMQEGVVFLPDQLLPMLPSETAPPPADNLR